MLIHHPSKLSLALKLFHSPCIVNCTRVSTDPLPTQEHVTHASFLGFCNIFRIFSEDVKQAGVSDSASALSCLCSFCQLFSSNPAVQMLANILLISNPWIVWMPTGRGNKAYWVNLNDHLSFSLISVFTQLLSNLY